MKISGEILIHENNELVLMRKNQILENGLEMLIQPRNWVECIYGVVIGVEDNPTPSTYTSIQSMENPIDGLIFPLISQDVTKLLSPDRGFKISNKFEKKLISGYGLIANLSITEMGLVITDGIDSRLLARIVSLPDQYIYTFPDDKDVVLTWNLNINVDCGESE